MFSFKKQIVKVYGYWKLFKYFLLDYTHKNRMAKICKIIRDMEQLVAFAKRIIRITSWLFWF